MTINKLFPVKNSSLKPYIKHYFLIDFSEMETDSFSFPPIGFPVLQFQFGEKSDFYGHYHTFTNSVLIGQCTRHIHLKPTKQVKLIGVNFQPYGLFNLLGISPSEFINSGIDSNKIFGIDAITHITDTLKIKGVEAGIDEIENLLLSNQNKKNSPHMYFDAIVDKIELENGLVNYADLLHKNISRRTFQRYFKEVVGVSPKLYCQILRHRFIMELLYKKPDIKWSDILLNGFYYDFAHFTKDFTKFSGLTPRKYLPLKNSFASVLLNY